MSISDPVGRLRALMPTLYALYLPAFALLGGIVLLRVVYGIPMALFTRDAAQITGSAPFIGALSNLGILLWCTAAATALFAAALAGRRDGNGEAIGFLRAGAALTVLLLFDDLFLLHDVVFPDYLHVSQLLVYVAYALAAAGFLLRFRRHILARTDYPLLAIALAGFALSIGMDLVDEHILIPGTYILEDGFKFLGIVGWCGYFVRSAARALSTG